VEAPWDAKGVLLSGYAIMSRVGPLASCYFFCPFGLQDALMNVGSCDVREMSWTASCWFALAPQERDKAMLLSQLTFRESESFDQGRRSEMRRPPDRFWASLAWCPFLFSHPPSLPEIKYVRGSFVVYWSYAPKRMAFSEMGLSYIFHFEVSCAYT